MSETRAATWIERLNQLGITRRLPEHLTQTVVDAAQRKPLGERYDLPDGGVPGLVLRVGPDGLAVFSLRFRNQAGKQKRFTVGAAKVLDLDHARQRARAELLKVGQGSDPSEERQAGRVAAVAAQKSTVRAYLTEVYGPHVLAHNKAGGVPKTEGGTSTGDYARILHSWAPLLDRPFASVTRDDIEGVLSDRKAKGAAAWTLLRDWSSFRAMLSDAVDRRVLAAVPMNKLPRPIRKMKGNKRVRWLGQHDTPEQLAEGKGEHKRFTDALDKAADVQGCTGDFLRFAVRLALATGMRRGEVVRLTKAMINTREQTITLPASVTKSNKSRVVYLNTQALAALGAWKLRGTAGELCPGNPEIWEDRITQQGWPALCIAAGSDDLHFHDLRHHFAVTMLKSGATLEQVRDALGHASVTQTEKYAHLVPSDVRAAVLGMGKA